MISSQFLNKSGGKSWSRTAHWIHLSDEYRETLISLIKSYCKIDKYYENIIDRLELKK